MSAPTPAQVARTKPKRPQGKPARGPYTTSTPASVTVSELQILRSGGIIERRSDGTTSTPDERRRAVLEADRARFIERAALHMRKGDTVAWQKNWARATRVDMLVSQGINEGRWES